MAFVFSVGKPYRQVNYSTLCEINCYSANLEEHCIYLRSTHSDLDLDFYRFY